MATVTTVQLVDDLDQTSEATCTHTLTLDGRTVTLDLTEEHSSELLTALDPWLRAGRTPTTRQRPRGWSRETSDARQIRQWARENGHEISERGRISTALRAAYTAAQGDGQ